MERHDFINSEYLCILGWDGGSEGDYEVYSCANELEVFQILTNRIKEELDVHFEDDNSADFDMWENYEPDIRAYVDMLKTTEVIRNPSIIKDCYENFFSSSWWFKVIDSYGSVWFERER